MNQQAMLRKIKKMQQEMMDTQREIEQTIFTASSGGVVTVDVNGAKEIIAVKVSDDFEATSPEDFELLSDMIVASCNQAYKQIEQTTQEKMSKYSSLLGGMGGGLF